MEKERNLVEMFVWGMIRGFFCIFVYSLTTIPGFNVDPFPSILSTFAGMVEGCIHMLISFKRDYYTSKIFIRDQIGTAGMFLMFFLLSYLSMEYGAGISILNGVALCLGSLLIIGIIICIKNNFYNLKY